MIKSNVGANSVRQKMLLAVLLIFAVLTVGMITGCSGGKKNKGGETLEGFVALDLFYTNYSNFTQSGGWNDGGNTLINNYFIDSVQFAHVYNETINEPLDIWGNVKIELLKEYPYYFLVEYYNSAGEYVDDVPAGDFNIKVSPSSLATVNKSTGSITAGSTAGTGTVTITYKGLSYTLDLEVVNGFGPV